MGSGSGSGPQGGFGFGVGFSQGSLCGRGTVNTARACFRKHHPRGTIRGAQPPEALQGNWLLRGDLRLSEASTGASSRGSEGLCRALRGPVGDFQRFIGKGQKDVHKRGIHAYGEHPGDHNHQDFPKSTAIQMGGVLRYK